MKERSNLRIVAGIAMILLSFAFYSLHYYLFRDLHHIFIYLVGDIAFVFIEVLLVTLIIHQTLNEWEKKSHLKKLNMVIEVFFSEFGKRFLGCVSRFDKNLGKITDVIIDKGNSHDLNFKAAYKAVASYKADIEIENIDIEKLTQLLKANRGFLVTLLQNPNLLEHETFTETLMSIFHIAEELAARDLDVLSEEDVKHIKKDIERAYNNLIHEWLRYMHYIKVHYPYFFLFAMRTNPFDENVFINDEEQDLLKSELAAYEL